MSVEILSEQHIAGARAAAENVCHEAPDPFMRGMLALFDSHEALRADRDRLAARVADLEAFVREPVPFGAYVRWCQDGNTADADAMQAWSDARAAALGAPGGES